MNILEAYAKKLSVSEKVYAKEHGGAELSQMKKAAIARVLANTSEYLNEAFENSVGTQLANMKTFKKFCLDLTTVALPNLIANDLVIVYPMKSRTGYIQYLQFVAGTNKGGVAQGDVFNDVFHLGQMTDARVNYTAAAVTESYTSAATPVAITPAWGPVERAIGTYDNSGVETKYDFKYFVGDTFTTWSYGTFDADGKVPASIQTADTKITIAYKYDNVIIPQNDLPILNARMEGISLEAKARRIAVYYSQMAAFQAKTEMGIDLGEVLATQACAELSYEIDTEVVKLLVDNANKDFISVDMTFNKRLPLGVNKRDHFAGFVETIENGSQHIYDLTQKHAANYMIASSSLKPMLSLIDGWKAASSAKINGPYFAGTVNGIKVYISPAIKANEFVLGYNGDDMVTSAAVFAPYMAIVPTQLLGYADGSMSQGFSTLYDLKMLNPYLLIAGKVVDQDATGTVTYVADAYKNA